MLPLPPPPVSPFLPLHLLCCSCSPPSRRQDGQGTQQPASRDQQAQLFLTEEARTGRLAQPGLRLRVRVRVPGRLGRSRRRSRIRVGEQRESAAGAQSGRSAEQIHQSDPGLAEQVSPRTESCRVGRGADLCHMASCCYLLRPRFTLPPRHHAGELEEWGGLGALASNLPANQATRRPEFQDRRHKSEAKASPAPPGGGLQLGEERSVRGGVLPSGGSGATGRRHSASRWGPRSHRARPVGLHDLGSRRCVSTPPPSFDTDVNCSLISCKNSSCQAEAKRRRPATRACVW